MSQSNPRQPPSVSQQSAHPRTPTLTCSTSHSGLSDMLYPSPSQLSSPAGAISHQGAATNFISGREMAPYRPQVDLSNIAAFNVSQCPASGYGDQQIGGSNPTALQPSPLAPGLGNQEEHRAGPAALQNGGHYSGKFLPNALPSNTTPYRGWESVSQLPIFHNVHTVDRFAPSASDQCSSLHPSEAISAMEHSSPFKIGGVKHPKEEGFVMKTGRRMDSGRFGASPSLIPCGNYDAIDPADSTLQLSEAIWEPSSSCSSEVLHRVSDGTYIGNADVQTLGKGKLKRGAIWDGSSPSMLTDTFRHVPLPYDEAQREREFKALDEETSYAPTRQDRRRVQNRLAQRAFRARCKSNATEAVQHTVDLEYLSITQTQQIEQMAHVISSLQTENAQLKRIPSDRDSALALLNPVSGPSHSQPHQHLSQ